MKMGPKITDQKYFLATTALEEFWDTSMPIVFLGEWCKLYKRREFWQKLNHVTINSPLSEMESFKKAFNYLNQVYEKLLFLLSSRMNIIHGTNHGERYWRIVIGPWLAQYVQIIYDRYLSIKTAMKQYPGFKTIVLSDRSFITPRNSSHFNSLVLDDSYNIQIYTRIIKELSGNKYPSRPLKVVPYIGSQINNGLQLKAMLRQLAKYVIKLGRVNMRIEKKPIIMRLSCFPYLKDYIDADKVGYDRSKDLELPDIPINNEFRDRLRMVNSPDDEYISLLCRMIPFDMPQCFIEGYNSIQSKALKLYPKEPKVIFSDIGLIFDECFKHWAADRAEKGVYLVSAQHGGNYGSLAFLQGEEHEIAVNDRYYTWGWDKNDNDEKVVSFPAIKFMGKHELGASNAKEGILLVANTFPRYLYRMITISNYKFTDYLSWQSSFISSLPIDHRARLRMRLFVADFGWECKQRLRDSFPDLKFEGWDIPFISSLNNCRIHVSDHLATTFIEGLALNKPTILFWDKDTFMLRPEAQPYYDELRSVGILYHSPEEAAAAVSNVYDDVESWWNDGKRQEVVNKFCERFARKSKNPSEELDRELERMLELANGRK